MIANELFIVYWCVAQCSTKYKITISIQCHMDYGAIIYLKRDFICPNNTTKTTQINEHAKYYTLNTRYSWLLTPVMLSICVYILQGKNNYCRNNFRNSLIFWWKMWKSIWPTTPRSSPIFLCRCEYVCFAFWLFDLCFKSL